MVQDLIRLVSPITNNQIIVWETSDTDGELPTVVTYALHPAPTADARATKLLGIGLPNKIWLGNMVVIHII